MKKMFISTVLLGAILPSGVLASTELSLSPKLEPSARKGELVQVDSVGNNEENDAIEGSFFKKLEKVLSDVLGDLRFSVKRLEVPGHDEIGYDVKIKDGHKVIYSDQIVVPSDDDSAVRECNNVLPGLGDKIAANREKFEELVLQLMCLIQGYEGLPEVLQDILSFEQVIDRAYDTFSDELTEFLNKEEFLLVAGTYRDEDSDSEDIFEKNECECETVFKKRNMSYGELKEELLKNHSRLSTLIILRTFLPEVQMYLSSKQLMSKVRPDSESEDEGVSGADETSKLSEI